MASFFQPPIGLGARKLKIQRNGVDVATFSANEPNLTDGTDAPMIANIEIPTSDVKTSTTGQFNTTTGGLLESCDVTLTPKQDLHGYDKPWVGGAGKNKLGIKLSDVKLLNTIGTWSGNTYTIYGGNVIFNEDVDGYITSITLDGSFNFDIYPILQNESVYANQMRIFVDKVDSNNWNLAILNPTNTAIVAYASTSGAVINADSYGRLRFFVKSNVTYSNYTIHFMVCLSSVSDATFEPYSNVCPIEGHSSVEVGNVGKNLCNNSTNIVGYYDAYGVYVASDDHRTSALIEVEPNTTYIGSLFDTSNNSRVGNLVYTEWDENQNFIRQITNETVTVGNTTKYLRVRNYNSQSTIVKTDHYAYQLEEGLTATTYEPYNGTDYTIPLGQTVYGGSDDVISGVGSDTDEKAGLYSGFSYSTTNGYFYKFVSTNYDAVTACEIFKPSTETDVVNHTEPNIIAFQSNGNLLIYAPDYGSDTTSFNNDVSAYYYTRHRKTANALSTTPQQIETLVGENNVTTPLEKQSLNSLTYKEIMSWDDVSDNFKASMNSVGDNSFTFSQGNDTTSVTIVDRSRAKAECLAYINAQEGMVVPDMAYKAYAVGEHFMHKGKFCTAITAIAQGDMLTLNTNYVEGNISDYLSVKEYTASINANASSYATMHTNTVRRSGNHVSVQIRFNITNMPANANQNILNLPFKLSGGVKFGQLNSNTAPFKLLDVGMYLVSNGNVVQLNEQLSNGDYYFSIDYLTNDPL